MLALVIGLPLAAVAGGIATFVIAERNADPGDPRVRRVAQTQTVDLAADREASRQGYAATATIDTDGVNAWSSRQPGRPRPACASCSATSPTRAATAT